MLHTGLFLSLSVLNLTSVTVLNLKFPIAAFFFLHKGHLLSQKLTMSIKLPAWALSESQAVTYQVLFFFPPIDQTVL